MKASTGHIWKAASKEESRPILTGVYFDVEKATLSASDSYIGAEVPCEVEDGDESGIIPAAAIKAANGQSLRIAKGKAVLKVPGGERSWDLITSEKEFPPIGELISKADESAVPLGLNADFFQALAHALGVNSRLGQAAEFHPSHPLRAQLVRCGDAAGIIMPVRLASTNGATPPALALDDDDAVVAAVQAAASKLNSRRGKKAAAQTFRKTLVASPEDGS